MFYFILERDELPKICRKLRGDSYIVSERIRVEHNQNDNLLQQDDWRELNWTESGQVPLSSGRQADKRGE